MGELADWDWGHELSRCDVENLDPVVTGVRHVNPVSIGIELDVL